MSFDFVGINGTSYSLPSLPDVANNYKHFIIIKRYTEYHIMFFNDSISFFKPPYNSFIVTADDGYNSGYYKGVSSWTYMGGSSNKSVGDFEAPQCNIIYISESLSLYKNEILSFRTLSTNAQITIKPQSIEPYTLRPIVEGQNLSPAHVFGEVFSILPVLLVVFISFIGIRKGINWLAGLFRHF